MVIYKTGSADKPGDFAGGVIGLSTIESSSDFTKVDLNFGYRLGTTFDDYLQSDGSDTDFIGIDNSFRPLPYSFPTTSQLTNSAPTSLLRVDAAHSLPNNFDTNKSEAFLDSGFGFSLGRKINIGSSKIYSVNEGNYIHFPQGIKNYIKYCQKEEGERRYCASLQRGWYKEAR